MSVSARDFSLSVISSMFLNDIFSSSISMQSLVDTTQRSQYLILHTLDVDAVIAVGSICSQRSRLIKLDFPALASPDHTKNTFIRIVHKIEKKSLIIMFFVFKEEGRIQNIHCHIKKAFLMHCLNMQNNKIHSFFFISREIEQFFFL